MAEITNEEIKQLREMTGAGMMDCKKALQEHNGDMTKAADALRTKGLAKAAKKVDRTTGEGRIVSYIHGEGTVGVLLQVNCETDFVARNSDFEILCKDIAMHIAAMNPQAIRGEDLDPELIKKEEEIQKEILVNEGKKPEQIEKILPGKIKKFQSEMCLLDQAFVKDPKKTIGDLINEAISKFGENITVGRFQRYSNS
jgi:elongation factor Ts